MRDIDKARTIRDEILRSSASSDHAQVTWDKAVIDGVEHPCWRIEANGWSATVSTLWDIMATGGRAPSLKEGDRFDLIRRHVIEVRTEPDGDLVLGMSYGEGECEDHLFAFTPGSWEERFAFQIARVQGRRLAAVAHRADPAPGTSLRTASPPPTIRNSRARVADRG